MTVSEDLINKAPRLRIAMIGLGDIARKAYLPVLSARPDVELILVTRNEKILAELGEAYRIPQRFTELQEALTVPLDAAFVHTATEAHAETVTILLQAGVPVFVDKPLTYSYDTAAPLVDLAEQRKLSLMVGFNRRYAPAYANLKELLQRDLIFMQKHRTGPVDQPRRVIFDDFIHVVDTLRFLAPGPITEVVVSHGQQADKLAHVVVHLLGAGFSMTGAMHRQSGAAEEVLDVVGGGRRVRVIDVNEVVDYAGTERLHRPDPWASVGYSRGFSQMCDYFLTTIKSGEVLSAADALETHALCERIVSLIK